MIRQEYRNQVILLLTILPEVNKEKCFALHGGTAINLFIMNMPRLSVDIDVTYKPIEERDVSLRKINEALLRIKASIESQVAAVEVTHLTSQLKLLISTKDASIKLEVNQIKRGVYAPSFEAVLCERAQNDFDIFCSMSVVSLGQVYGGKICAALSRQHPRDLFDIKLLLEKLGLSNEVKIGLLFCLLGDSRPFHEILSPTLLDQQYVMENQFQGMTSEPFTYDDFIDTRQRLISEVQGCLTDYDKEFLLGVMRLEPDWSKYSFQDFPAIRWKLMNLEKLNVENEKKYKEQYIALEQLLLSR